MPDQKTVWDNMNTEEITSILRDVQIETAAVLTSGDVTQQRWARTTGVIATALLDLYMPDGGTPPAGQDTKHKETAHTDTAQTHETDKVKPK